MATIVEMINPLTGLPEQVDKLDHTAQEIDDAVDLAPQLSNPNLLDNWYFGNPVNQRGQNEYTNSDSYSYGIDRWICKGIALSDTGITFTGSGSFMDQILELAKKVALSGKAVTASVLLDNGELIYGTLQFESSMSEQKFFATGNIQLVLLANGIIRLYSIGNYTAVAVKLELGTQQTLAHQENGNWVLNEIPNYGEQLARCQRYRTEREKATGYVSYSSGGVVAISPMAGCSFPTTMRSNPSCAIFAADVAKTANKVSYYSNFESLADGTVASVSADDNGIYAIGLQNSSIQVGTIVEFCYVATAEL